MDLLTGGIQSLMGSVMGAFYLDATLERSTMTEDEGGSITVGPPTTQPVKVQEDQIDEAYRTEVGIPQTAKRFLVLQAGVTGVVDGDCRLVVGGVRYDLSRPRQDPAKAYWDVIGVPV